MKNKKDFHFIRKDGAGGLLGDQAFRATQNLGRNFEQTFAGIPAFCRRRLTRNLTDPNNPVDVVVSGVPLDLFTSYRPGTRLGPRGVRAASVQLSELDAFPFGMAMEHGQSYPDMVGGFDPFSHLAVVDYGDCELMFDQPTTIPLTIEQHITQIIQQKNSQQQPIRTATIGGDHFITYPILRAHAKIYGKALSLLHFDAHPDTWPDDGKQMNHGTMFARALREGLIDPKTSLQIGIRTIAPRMGVNVITADDFHELGVKGSLQKIAEIVRGQYTYLTFDIDCLDPAFAPGTGTPVAGGLTSREALNIIRGLHQIDGLNIIGADLVEVSPPFDHAEVTALAGAHILHDIICHWALKKIA